MLDAFLIFYFSFALGFWFGAWINHKKHLWDVPLTSLLLGFIGTLFWPLILTFYLMFPDLQKDKGFKQ